MGCLWSLMVLKRSRPNPDIDPTTRRSASVSPKRSLDQLCSILARSMSAMRTFQTFAAAAPMAALDERARSQTVVIAGDRNTCVLCRKPSTLSEEQQTKRYCHSEVRCYGVGCERRKAMHEQCSVATRNDCCSRTHHGASGKTSCRRYRSGSP